MKIKLTASIAVCLFISQFVNCDKVDVERRPKRRRRRANKSRCPPTPHTTRRHWTATLSTRRADRTARVHCAPRQHCAVSPCYWIQLVQLVYFQSFCFLPD